MILAAEKTNKDSDTNPISFAMGTPGEVRVHRSRANNRPVKVIASATTRSLGEGLGIISVLSSPLFHATRVPTARADTRGEEYGIS
jgi:hypothetical protein